MKKLITILVYRVLMALLFIGSIMAFTLLSGRYDCDHCQQKGYTKAFEDIEDIMRERSIKHFDKDTIYQFEVSDTVIFQLSKQGIYEVTR